jgi:hypothetical protein
MPIGAGTAAAIGAAGAVGGGLIAGSAAKKAAQTQANAANQAAQLQLNMFNTVRGDLAPYRAAGQAALPGFYALMGIPQQSVNYGYGTSSPSYYTSAGGATIDPTALGFSSQGWGNLAPDQIQQILIDRPDVGAEYERAMANGSAQQRGLDSRDAYVADWYNRVRPTLGDQYVLPATTVAGGSNGAPSADANAQIQSFLENLPGYQFTKSQGTQAVESALAARGLGGLSGSLGKGLARFVTGLADSTYQQQLDNYYRAVGMGQSAANQTGAFATQTGSNVGSNIVGAGTALASGQVGAANALSGALSSAASIPFTSRILGNMYGGGSTYGGGYGAVSYPGISGFDSPIIFSSAA